MFDRECSLLCKPYFVRDISDEYLFQTEKIHVRDGQHAS